MKENTAESKKEINTFSTKTTTNTSVTIKTQNRVEEHQCLETGYIVVEHFHNTCNQYHTEIHRSHLHNNFLHDHVTTVILFLHLMTDQLKMILYIEN